MVSNPEFLREGTAVQDMLFPDRIVLGSASRRALDVKLKSGYREDGQTWTDVRAEDGAMIEYHPDRHSAQAYVGDPDVVHEAIRTG